MSSGEIVGAQYPIQKVFSDDFTFTMPGYQRPYAWGVEHASALLDDLLAFLGGDDVPPHEREPYFLGSIVLVKADGPEAETVDGQQRLVTLTILLAALRALLPADFAADITPFLYGAPNRLLGSSERYRVRLRERDAAFFQRHIQQEGGIARIGSLVPEDLSDSQQRIRENAMLYLKRLGDLHEGTRVRLAQYVVARCLLVIVSTADLDAAYRIFSVLNDRGLDLSYTDILKAEVIGTVPPDRREYYTARWEDIEQSLGRHAFAELFSHIRMIVRKVRARESLLKEFRGAVLRATGSPERFMDTVLIPYGEAYHTIRGATYASTRQAEAVNAALHSLNAISDTDWSPAAIRFMSERGQDPAALGRFLADLERLAAGMMILRYGPPARATRYGRLLTQMDEVSGNVEALYTEDAPLQLTAQERTNILHTLDKNLDSHNTHVRKYILLLLESLLGGLSAEQIPSTVTVEHVLPQNPPAGSQWAKWFPDSRARERFVHLLGNLVLLSRTKNTAAANYDFAKKKQAYLAADGGARFALTEQVLRERTWTAEVITRRQRELLAVLQRHWRL